MNTELRLAIYDIGKDIAGLTGGFWYIEADEKKISYPYAVFSFLPNAVSRDSASKFEDYYVQMNVYDKDGDNIEVVKDNLTTAFDDSESKFTLASWIFTRIERQFSVPQKIDKVYMITTQYKIELTKR